LFFLLVISIRDCISIRFCYNNKEGGVYNEAPSEDNN